MIVSRYHLDKARQVYIPFRYDAEKGTWVSLIVPEGYFLNPMEAARVCLTHALSAWMNLIQESRLLRALCEHPEFEFDGDSVDADMIRGHARTICDGLALTSEQLHRMLDGPDDDDVLHIHGQGLPGVDLPVSAVGLEELTLLLDSKPDAASPDDRFLAMLKTSWGFSHDGNRETLTSEGFMRAFAWLVRKGASLIAEEDAAASDISQMTKNDAEPADRP